MLRAYAIGMGAGTQVLTHAPWLLLGVELTETSRAVAMGAGWVINVLVAEAVIYSTSRPAVGQQREKHQENPYRAGAT